MKSSARRVALFVLFGLGFLGPASTAAAYPYPTPSGTRIVGGAIEQAWLRLGGSYGFLGWPRTDETRTPFRTGAFNHFDGGSIYWSPRTGAHEVHGDIRAKWSSAGWENSSVGFPVTDENPIRGGAFQHFQTGSIYWSPETGSHIVLGAIRDKWGSLGWENSPLGFPVTDEYAIPGGARSDFQEGCITWTPSTGAVVGCTARPDNPGNSKDCDDFPVWRQAQDWFEYYHPHYGDVANLDGDDDLIACERLPGAP